MRSIAERKGVSLGVDFPPQEPGVCEWRATGSTLTGRGAL